jgi:hypothetical protein
MIFERVIFSEGLQWMLAQAYAVSGDVSYREAMVNLLELNFVPAPLMDQDSDGEVDGSSVRFDQLESEAAGIPGRTWDGHNGFPWYHSMNAWAMNEAYVALRDRLCRARRSCRSAWRLPVVDQQHTVRA